MLSLQAGNRKHFFRVPIEFIETLSNGPQFFVPGTPKIFENVPEKCLYMGHGKSRWSMNNIVGRLSSVRYDFIRFLQLN